MKLNVKHLGIRATASIDNWIENQIATLAPVLKIDEAKVRLVCVSKTSPPYHASVHLVTPGPDIHAEANDYTLQATIGKVIKVLRAKIQHRSDRRRNNAKNKFAVSAGYSHAANRH